MNTKSNTANILFGSAALVAVCLCCLVLFIIFPSDNQLSAPQIIPEFPTFDFQFPTESVRISVIEYRVLGSGMATLTYQNSTGQAEQQDVTLPWSYPRFYARTHQFLYISAQLQSTGEITCTIYLNGSKWKSSTSNGQYVICSADASAP